MTTIDDDPLEKYYFVHEEETICGQTVTSITEDFIEEYPSVVDRFFTRFYYINKVANDEDVPYQVLFHSNRVCLICLAPQHPALKEGIVNLNFNIGNADRSKNAVKGKGKKGGMPLQADSALALITTKTGKTYKVPSCIRSKLIEVNLAFVEHPQRLETTAEGEGYLAIVLPKPEHCDEIKASLLTEEQYAEWLTNQNSLKKSTAQ